MFNRVKYDTCSTRTEFADNVSVFDHTMDLGRFVHTAPCRNEKGLLGGNVASTIAAHPNKQNASAVRGDMVALENDLRGGNRPNTHCPSYKFAPGKVQGKEYIKPVCHPAVDTTPLHLKSCQFQDFPEVPLAPVAVPFSCPAPGR